ncbi:uncharacterized protein LOC120251229 isoform X3 [Dioscorea cayenensis subsp. rotundata]|uniref:Uncharacterized protein LOC120251229 isoform X3 n=1 Tax=Dioscorea cayennensis subsp. rotundata TaxID=55577 RepID=A0AB40ALH8_DIOCR|nr:uncharacterized protein LOC120251229 isoform X3 [Dioscorea cayenensis subsp. rotundata]
MATASISPSRNFFLSWKSGDFKIHPAFLSLKSGFQSTCRNGSSNRVHALPWFFTDFTSIQGTHLSRRCSVIVCTGSQNYDFNEKMKLPLDIYDHDGKLISYVDYSLKLLHELAANVFADFKSHESSKNFLKLVKAWIGVDVDLHLRQTAYLAAVYGFLKAVMDMVSMFDDQYLLCISLTSNLSLIMECIEGVLGNKDLELMKRFRIEQVLVLNRYFAPSLERWASEYAKWKTSNELKMISLTISSCIVVTKLGAQRISCPAFYTSLAETIQELFESARGLGSLGISYQFATMAGHEHEFLNIFGPKVLHHNTEDEILFWMTLLQKKLFAAFVKETFLHQLEGSFDNQVLARDLAILGLFAFLGRKTRLFLLHMGINDIEEPLKSFICYLECGILFVYPNLSSLCMYQQFMEVVTEEIKWLDLYSEVSRTRQQARKRSKQHPTQAEKEIILSAVFGVCSDIFSNFALYCKKTQKTPSVNVAIFLNERDPHEKLADLTANEIFEPPTTPNFTEIDQPVCSDKIFDAYPEAVNTDPPRSIIAKYSHFVLSTMTDLCMGIQLLFIDISVTISFLRKPLYGRKLTTTERKKIFQTFIDVICVIPLVVLMLLPVTAIGYVIILAVIKKLMPNLVPSSFSTERLDVIKQLTRAKKMKGHPSCGHVS